VVLYNNLYINPIHPQHLLFSTKPALPTPAFFHLASRWLAFRRQTEANGYLNATQPATKRTPTGVPLQEKDKITGHQKPLYRI
jgi:hypothetical protein